MSIRRSTKKKQMQRAGLRFPKKRKQGKQPKNLAPSDWANLHSSGLSARTVEENGIYTETDGGQIASILRWRNRAGQLGPCMVFPYRKLDGTERAFARIRPSYPRKQKGKTAKYEQPAGESLHAYFPIGSVASLTKPTDPIFITEGEKKALALDQNGFAAVGLCGVDCWGKNGTLIDDLQEIQWAGRSVYVAFDYDPKPTTRQNVKEAARRLADAIHAKGAKVFLLDIPAAPDGGKQGADDFLVTHGKAAFRSLVKQAREAHGINAVRVDSVKLEKVDWFWLNRIPYGALTLLDGDPGMGKSTVMCDLAARLTNGQALPGESLPSRRVKGGVLILSAEDDPGRTIRPRLEAAGADIGKVTLLTNANDMDGERQISLPDDIPDIKRLIKENQARLVIIDPLMAYIDSKVDTNIDASARRLLTRLSQLAGDTGVAIVLLRHLNKRSGTAAIYRGGGSIAFVAACRSGLVMGKDRENENLRVVASTKNNLGPAPKAITLTLATVKTKQGEASKVVWGEESNATADDIIDHEPRSESKKVDVCIAKLSEGLRERGPMLTAELYEIVGSETGASERTIKEARKRAKLPGGKQPGTGQWWVRLPSQEFMWVKALREKAGKKAKPK